MLPQKSCPNLTALKQRPGKAKNRKEIPRSLGKAGLTAAVPQPAPKRPYFWLFRLLALTLAPLAFLGAIELGLRVADYGYSAHFFRPYRISERTVLVENDQFARRFFPARLLRRPAPFVMDQPKKEGAFRIFVFGESAAMGDPEPSFSFARILEVLLRERYPGIRFEVVNLAFTAINSHVILPIARNAARRQGDVWLIYMGNNEVTGPFGPATVFGSHTPNLGLIRAGLALKSLKVGQALQGLTERWMASSKQTHTWAGLQMFASNQISQSDPRLESVYSHFEHNLHDILEQGRKAGAKIILSTVASNLKDCSPFASAHSQPLSEAQLTEWKSLIDSAGKLEVAGQFEAALSSYLKAADIDPRFAEVQFRVGRCYLALNRLEEARARFESARDLDALRFRADSRLNSIITNAAQLGSGAGVSLIDVNLALAQSAIDGSPGDDFFFDHVHLNFDGNYLLALTMAEQIAKLLPGDITNRTTGEWLTSSMAARHLAHTPWDQYRIYELMERRMLELPFATQSAHPLRRQRFVQKLVALRPAQQIAGLDEAASTYREALERAPADFHLHENFARLLFARGDFDGALQHNQTFAQLLPHHPAPYYNQALALNALGQRDQAARLFSEALRRRPDFAEAYHGLGLVRSQEGNPHEARAFFSKAIELRPDYVDALLNLGETWEKENQWQQARNYYFRALNVQSNSFAVRMRVGNILIATGDLLEATRHHAEAVRLQSRNAMTYFSELVQRAPDDPVAHFQLANAWAAQGQQDAAMQSLRQAIALKPEFWEARYLFGVELALQNKIADAANEFIEVTRLQPTFAPAHFNLGVALAKAGRLNDAAARFAETLRLDPKHQSAQQYLNNLRPLLLKPSAQGR